MERLTERMGRELVLKEAKRVELEKEAVEAERKRKSLEVKYEASLQDQIRMQMKVINILSEKFDQLVGGGDITDDGYKSTEEWSGEKEGRDPSPLTPRNTPRGAKQSILGPEHGKISSQREERDLRNRNKLMAFNLDNFDPVDTTKENWQNYETKPEMNTVLEELHLNFI